MEKKGIIKYDVVIDRYIIENKIFYEFFSWFWSVLCMHTLSLMIDFVYPCLRKPTSLEKEWLRTLFGKEWVSILEITCHKERFFRKSILRSGQKLDQRYKLIEGGSILRRIEHNINILLYYKKRMEKHFLHSNSKNNHQFIMHLLMRLVFPNFISLYDFERYFSINKSETYLISTSFTS